MEHPWVEEFIHKVFEGNLKDNALQIRDEKLKYINRPLYKYCYVCENANRNENTIDYNIDNFNNEVLFFQDPSKFNDPFDCFLGFSQSQLVKDLLLQEMRKQNKLTPDVKKLINIFFDDYDSAVGIDNLSVSEVLESMDNLISIIDDESTSYIKPLLNSLAESDSELLKRLLLNKTTIRDKQQIIDLTFDNADFKNYFLTNISSDSGEVIYEITRREMKLKIENLPDSTMFYDEENGESFTPLSALLNLSLLFKSTEFTQEDLDNIKQNFDAAAKEALQKGRTLISEQFRITCLSERMDSPLMWSHYANKHYGFCLEYDFTPTLTNIRYRDLIMAQLMLFPVHYSEDRPLLSKTLFNAKNYYNYKKTKKLPPQAIEKLMYGLLGKSSDWEYEKEWRIFQLNGATTMKLPKPRKLFLGANMEDETKQHLIEIAKAKHIPVFQMFLTSDKYKFDYYQVL